MFNGQCTRSLRIKNGLYIPGDIMTGSALMVSFHTEEMNSMNAWCELKAALTFHSEMAFTNKLMGLCQLHAKTKIIF